MLSQGVMYATQALSVLAAEPDRNMLVRELAKSAGVPAPFLSKIVQTLARRGIVTTQRGVGGGVSLAHTPEEITLYDLCEALDDPIADPRYMLGTVMPSSDKQMCPCHAFWSRLRNDYIKYLRRTNLQTVGRMSEG